MKQLSDSELLDAVKERFEIAAIAGRSVFARLAGLDPDAHQALTWAAMEIVRQREDENWTIEHDDEHNEGQMATAASCYAYLAGEQVRAPWRTTPPNLETPPSWPWDAQWWKPKNIHRNLIRAIALLAVEWGRWNRANLSDFAKPPPATTPHEGKS